MPNTRLAIGRCSSPGAPPTPPAPPPPEDAYKITTSHTNDCPSEFGAIPAS